MIHINILTWDGQTGQKVDVLEKYRRYIFAGALFENFGAYLPIVSESFLLERKFYF